MNLREEILRVIMSNVYARREYAENLTDEILKTINIWTDKEKQKNK